MGDNLQTTNKRETSRAAIPLEDNPNCDALGAMLHNSPMYNLFVSGLTSQSHVKFPKKTKQTLHEQLKASNYGWRKPPLHFVGENPKWFACLAGFVGLELTKTAKQNFTLGDETRHLKKLVQIIESTIPKMIDWYNCSILSAFLLLLVQNLPF